jgi:hypothetical protein
MLNHKTIAEDNIKGFRFGPRGVRNLFRGASPPSSSTVPLPVFTTLDEKFPVPLTFAFVFPARNAVESECSQPRKRLEIQ